MPLVATPAAADANAYVTVAEADAYFGAGGAWDALDVEAKEKLIIDSTSFLDAAFGIHYVGTPANGRVQALMWPRSNAIDDMGNTIPADEIPREVKRSIYEAIVFEMAKPRSASFASALEFPVQEEKIGPLETKYAVYSGGNAKSLNMSEAIKPYLSPVLRLVRNFVALV